MSFKESIQQVRKRPGMYVGDLNSAGVSEVYKCLVELVDTASSARITELKVVISDTTLEMELSFKRGTRLDSNFLNIEDLPWELCVCIGLCSSVECVIYGENSSEEFMFQHGEMISIINGENLADIGEIVKLRFNIKTDDSFALLSFKKSDFYQLASLLKIKAICEPQWRFTIEAGDRSALYHYPEGVKDLLLEEYWFAANRFHWSEIPKVEIFTHTDENGIIEIYKLTASLLESGIRGIVNGLMINEGTHVKGANNALSRFPELRDSTQIVILLKLNDVRFNAPTKSVLANKEIEGIVESLLMEGLGSK